MSNIQSLDDALRAGHSYRNFMPHDVDVIREHNGDQEALQFIEYIESERWEPMLDAINDLLETFETTAEQELFARRSPELALWVQKYRLVSPAHTQTQLDEILQTAGTDELTADGDRVVQSHDRHAYPPPDVSDSGTFDEQLQQLVTKYLDDPPYTDYTPWDFYQILQQHGREGVSINTATAELAMQLPTTAAWVKEHAEQGHVVYPTDMLRFVNRALYDGTMATASSDTLSMYARLDPDEGRMFTRRNPGMLMMMDVYGRTEGLIHGEQLQPHEYPVLQPE